MLDYRVGWDDDDRVGVGGKGKTTTSRSGVVVRVAATRLGGDGKGREGKGEQQLVQTKTTIELLSKLLFMHLSTENVIVAFHTSSANDGHVSSFSSSRVFIFKVLVKLKLKFEKIILI